MHELYELKEKLCEELEKYSKKELTASSLEYIDKLAHAAKNVEKLCESAEEYSMGNSSYARARGGRGGRGGYSREYSRDGGMSYESGRYSRDGGSYAMADSMISELRELRQNAPDERTRMEFDRFIKKMEQM